MAANTGQTRPDDIWLTTQEVPRGECPDVTPTINCDDPSLGPFETGKPYLCEGDGERVAAWCASTRVGVMSLDARRGGTRWQTPRPDARRPSRTRRQPVAPVGAALPKG